ncbi:apolipoprotein C-I [Anguilla anguilla]|nr:apolipoprotein C-I [Anguilla anguilla]
MKLPVAIAVLFLVLAANTEAQDAQEPTIEERFQTFGNQMKAFAEDLSQKTKGVFEDIHKSDAAVNTRNWFTEAFGKVKDKLAETFQQ